MQKIVFVTGKGGVGKSVYAASLAQKYSEMGKKTLLVELGDESFFKSFLNLPEVKYMPTRSKNQWDLAIWSGADCLREYALHLLKSEAIYRLFFENKVSRALIQIAPGLPELAILGKVTSGPRRHGPSSPHEVIVVDAYATGHFLALMRAPKGLSEAIHFGPMGEQSRSILKTIMDLNICEYHIVSLAEELPIKETIELYDQLKTEFNIDSRIVLNKTLETNLESSQLRPEQNTFVKYVKETLVREREARLLLKTRNLNLTEIPHIYDQTSYTLIERIATEILL
ncbi:MAG: arsenical pump-driving ATPase [Bdellovibrionaceae bacterium]|nr:arsenical pump-driving ATPase [Pseudobdellovibrionaceae bacterium]